MKIIVILLSCLALTLGKGLPRLPLRVLLRGHAPPMRPLIVGGVPAEPYEFPFVVSIQRRSFTGFAHSCGGSIYNGDYVLTAAHCVDGASLNNLQVVAAIYNQTVPGELAQVTPVSEFVIHPQYTSITYENDIAVVRVTTAFQFNQQVASIPIVAAGTSTSPGTLTTVIGWGSSSTGGAYSNVLYKVNVPIVSDDDCRVNYGVSDIKDSMICAGYQQGGADACQGDSGGPLFVKSTGVLVGITSWGYGCGAPGYPGVYTEVSYFSEWVQSLAGGQ